MSARSTALILTLALGAPLGGQELQTDQVDAVFADIPADGPGCAVGVVRAGELEYGKGYGMANLDYGLPITTTSNFYLGSIGKQFTAAAIAHAARAGHLSLDEPIQTWLPDMPEYERPITVRHLVHHVSGIRDYLTLQSLAGKNLEDISTVDDVLELIMRQKAGNFPAGDEYLYSNSGYFLLSEIVQRATGSTLRDYMQEHFLGPLGMERSRFHDDRQEIMDGRVVGYRQTDDGYRLMHPWNFDKVGSGGMYSSIEELAAWDRNYYTEEVGGEGFTEQLRERGQLTDGTELDYAFGLSHGEYRGLPTISHGGALAGFRADLLRFPEQEATMLVLCNFPTSNPGDRARKVADIVLSSDLEPARAAEQDEAEAAPLTSDELDAFVGHWRASMGIEVEIVREEDRLIFIQNGNRADLVTAAADRVLLPAADIVMQFNDPVDGRFHHMDVTQAGREFTAQRIVPGESAGSVATDDLEGSYYSVELDVTYRVAAHEEGIRVGMGPERERTLRDTGEDRWAGQGLVVEFEREEGSVRGFTLDAGRARGIYFERRPMSR